MTISGEASGSDLVISAETSNTSVTKTLSDEGANVFDAGVTLDFGYYVQFGGKGAVRIDEVRCSYQ